MGFIQDTAPRKRVTVAELIEKLQQFDLNLRVIVSGYEGGYNDLYEPVIKKIALDYNVDSYDFGLHEEVDSCLDVPESTQEDAVLIY